MFNSICTFRNCRLVMVFVQYKSFEHRFLKENPTYYLEYELFYRTYTITRLQFVLARPMQHHHEYSQVLMDTNVCKYSHSSKMVKTLMISAGKIVRKVQVNPELHHKYNRFISSWIIEYYQQIRKILYPICNRQLEYYMWIKSSKQTS